jgi:hypothetical protein
MNQARGNRWMNRILMHASWAATHTKKSYLASQYRRPVERRGQKRALIAVGHAILDHLLRDGTQCADLGADVFDRLEPLPLTHYYVKPLEHLGLSVKLEPSVTVRTKFSRQVVKRIFTPTLSNMIGTQKKRTPGKMRVRANSTAFTPSGRPWRLRARRSFALPSGRHRRSACRREPLRHRVTSWRAGPGSAAEWRASRDALRTADRNPH